MNMIRKRLISLNLAILMLLSLVLPAGAAELGEPAAVLTAEQPETLTAEPAVQADDSAEGIQAIFYTQDGEGNRVEHARVDASADGWTPPALPSTEGEGQNLYWFGSYTTEGGAYQQMQCLPGVGYPKLPAKAEFQPVPVTETRGILFCDNGKLAWTDSNRFMMISPSEGDTGEMGIKWYQLPDLNGRSFLGWTLMPENDRNYFTGEDRVPGTDKGWVTLYAQWTPEGQTAVYFGDAFYGFTNVGTTYMLPAAGNDNTIVTGWQVFCETENSNDQLRMTRTTDGGWQVDVPANAMKLRLYPEYQYFGSAVIGGKTYRFTENETFFSGDGWQLQSLSGGVQLRLNGYHGGAIDLPYTDLVTVTVSLFGDNAITGGTDAPALYSAGNLRFDSRCEANQHTSLTVTAGSGQCAVSAKNLQLAPHLTLTGGAGATALAPETHLLPTGEYSLYDAEDNELTKYPTGVSFLRTEAMSIPVKIEGNGGVAEGDKTTLERTYDSCILPNLEGLFAWSGHLYRGYISSDSRDDNGKIIGRTYRILWIDTKLEHFISFQTVYPIQEKETLSYNEGNGSGYIFCDNSEGTTVIAPTVTYTNANHGVLAYWQTQGSDTEAIRQYRPGDTVKESDGTEFYASTIQPDRQVLLIGNGKNFDSLGRSMRVSDRAYRLSAADGSQLLSWNTQADGTGTSYAPNTEIDLSGRTTPLVLYAQWQQAGKAAIYFDETFKEYAEPGTTYQFEAEAASEGCALLGWSGSWFQNGRHRGWQDAVQNEDGSWTIEIPADATELHLYKQEIMNQPFTIDGKSYQPGENKRFFSGDGWRLHCSSDGSVTLTLTNYDGGAINIPTAELAVWLWGKNYINGSTNGPALCGAGELYFVQNCDLDQNSHSELTITAGSGQNAISAKQIKPVAHIKLNGGEGAMAVNAEAEVVSSFMYCMCTKDGVVLTDDRYNSVQCLNVEPTYATVTLNGNGGVTTNDETVLKGLRYEIGSNVPNLGKIFTKSRCQYVGAEILQGNRNQKVIYGDCTINAVWADTGYDRFVSFYMDGSIKEKLNYDFGWGAGYLFRDNSKTVIAPTITYQDPVSNGNLVYWYVSDDGEESANAKQYLPGETVNEADGTVLRAATAYPNGEIVLMANGKTFAENGARVLIRTSLPNVTAADGAELVHWNTKPDGSGTAYGAYADISLRGRTEPLVLYAQWLQKGEIKVTIDMGKGSCAKSAKPGTRYELPEIIPSTEDRAFDHWGAYYRTKDGEYPDLEVKQDANGKWYVDIPADAAGVTCSAYFLPTGTFNIGGVLCKFERPDQVFKDENGKWTLHFEWRSNGCVVLRLYGYHGGLIKLPAEAAIEVYEDSTITATDKNEPALEAYSTLWLVTLCGEDKHPTLTVTGSDGQSAIDAAEVTFNGPHIVVTTQGAKAVKGEVNWAGDLCALRGGTSADNARALKWKEAQAEDLTYLKTDPLFSDVTFCGNGGKATDGSEKETLVKTYENGIYAKNLDRLFKKDGALYAGYAVGGGRYTGNSLYINGDGTVDILWAESKYPNFVAFHTEGAIMEKLDYDFGWGAGYLFRDNSKTVIAPTITYQDPVSNGNLVYWYVSDDGEESANAKQYLPGDVVKEESGTELYPAVVYANWNAAFMSNGKTFENGKLAIIAKQCPAEMKAADGTELIGWNTEKDGSGQAYAPGSKPDLSERTEPLVLYAQWKPVYVAKVEEPKPNEPQTGGTLTIKPRPTPAPDPGTGTDPEPTEPEKPAPIKKTQKVLVGVYRWGMMIAVLQGETDEKGEEIYCTVPKGLDLTGCALKLFVLSEAYAPDRKVEFILLSE